MDVIQIKGNIITIDAMGTQAEIAKKIKNRKAEYVLALKGNQGILYGEVNEYLEDEEFRRKIIKKGNYKKKLTQEIF